MRARAGGVGERWVWSHDPDPTSSASAGTDASVLAIKEEYRTGVLWQKLKAAHDAGYLIGAGTPANPNGDSPEEALKHHGLVQNHAFSVVQVRSAALGWARLGWAGLGCAALGSRLGCGCGAVRCV